MRVIFLDFDGVLNSSASYLFEERKRKALPRAAAKRIGPSSETLCHVCCSTFQFILDKVPDVQVVISSTWREHFTIEKLRKILTAYGVDASRVIDITPSMFKRDRGHEIKAWLGEHPEVTDFVIIDDFYIGAGYTDDHIVKTSEPIGLTLNNALSVIQMFGIHVDGIDICTMKGML